MRLLTIALIIIYSVLILISNIIDMIKNNKMTKGNLLFILGSILMMISVVMAITNWNNIFILIIAFILVQAGTIYNGYKMYGKPNISHNIVKIVIAIVMILLYMKL